MAERPENTPEKTYPVRDYLTGLLSRQGFLDEADRLIGDASYMTGAYALLYTNIKGFKNVNEIFGEASGDEVLRMVGDALQTRMEPILLSRFDSDHFVLIIEREKLYALDLTEFCSMAYSKANKHYHFELSMGIYYLGMDEDLSASAMTDRARLALESAGCRIFSEYDVNIRDAYIRRNTLISDMKESIENGEFIICFQPIVDAKTGVPVSAESLIRWNHHEFGMVPPSEFVPAFEAAETISSLDEFMIRSVLDFQEGEEKKGLARIPVSINLSRIDFYDEILIGDLRERILSGRLDPKLVKLEVTESAYAELENYATEFLQDMKKVGVKILLDDYGSGMSSLSTLESFDFDTVKLDMGFVRKIGKSRKAEIIIRSTIDMCHGIGTDVIAEGVENEAQRDFLVKAGCDMIQGFYFFKPMSAPEFEQLRTEGSRGEN